MSKAVKNNFLFLLISALIILTVMGLLFRVLAHKFIESDEVLIEKQTESNVIESDNELASLSQESLSLGAETEEDKINIENSLEKKTKKQIEIIKEENLAPVPPVINDTKEEDEKSKKGEANIIDTVIEDSAEIKARIRPYKLILKDVGEPYLNRFGLGPADYKKIKQAGIDVIQGNFDICAGASDVLIYLESAKDAGLQVIMPAGAGEAEWGYPCDDNYDEDQKPEWQKEKVQAFVKKWAYHPAIYAWNIANEDGQNFPNAQKYEDDFASHDQAITLTQLQTAYRDVKAADPSRPIMIRMNGWHFYDNDSDFFRAGNAFGSGVADIVMINAYSNVDEYFSDFVSVVSSRASSAIRLESPTSAIIIALGAWQEAPMWYLPTVQQFSNDVMNAKKTNSLVGIGIFKYGAEGTAWWMPEDAPELWARLLEFFAF